MLEAVLVKECADPSLKPAIVEQFVVAAGSADPLSITVKLAGRLILLPKITSADEAVAIVREYSDRAVVRVGLTQFPVRVGEPADLNPDLFDACENLRKGTATFARILRIVAKWYGSPAGEDAFPQIFDDAVHAWKTGEFEGVSVFQAPDPGEPIELPQQSGVRPVEGPAATSINDRAEETQAVERSGIRIDLSRIGGN